MKQVIKLALFDLVKEGSTSGPFLLAADQDDGENWTEAIPLAHNKVQLDALIRALESLRDELPDGPAPKWEPKIGDVVFARHDRALDREYVSEAQRERALFGFGIGVVIRTSDAHKSFTLRRKGGHVREAVFNLSELSPIGAEL